MRLFKKQIPSLLLALAVLISTFAEMPFNGKSAFAAEQDHELLTDEFSAYGTSSFGDMFARSVSEAQQEQIENNGYNIFSIEVFGKPLRRNFPSGITARFPLRFMMKRAILCWEWALRS